MVISLLYIACISYAISVGYPLILVCTDDGPNCTCYAKDQYMPDIAIWLQNDKGGQYQLVSTVHIRV